MFAHGKTPDNSVMKKAIRKEFGMPKGSDFQVELKELKSHGAKNQTWAKSGELAMMLI